MARPKKDSPQTNGNDPTAHEDGSTLPTVGWLSLVKAKGGYAVVWDIQ